MDQRCLRDEQRPELGARPAYLRPLAYICGTCPGPGLEPKAGGGALAEGVSGAGPEPEGRVSRGKAPGWGRVRGGARAGGAGPGLAPGPLLALWPEPSEARWLSPSRPSSAARGNEGSGRLPAAGRPFLGPTWWEARAGSAAGIRSPGSWRPSVWPGSSQERESWREGLEGAGAARLGGRGPGCQLPGSAGLRPLVRASSLALRPLLPAEAPACPLWAPNPDFHSLPEAPRRILPSVRH